MKTAAISDLKAKLSQHIAYVKRGEEVLVTDRGKPVARIVPIEDAGLEDLRRADLIRRGVIRPGRGGISPELLKRFPVAEIPYADIARIIAEEREDRI